MQHVERLECGEVSVRDSRSQGEVRPDLGSEFLLLMHVSCVACIRWDDLDHRFRIRKERGARQYPRTLHLQAVLRCRGLHSADASTALLSPRAVSDGKYYVGEGMRCCTIW
jgi:hypothetical protein